MKDDKEYFDELDKTGHFDFGNLRRNLEDTDQFLFSDLESRMNRNSNSDKGRRNTRVNRGISTPIKEAKKEYENPKRKNSKVSSKKKGSAKKVVLGICVTLTILITVGAGAVFAFFNGFFSGDIPASTKPVDGIVNILLVGKDIGIVDDSALEEGQSVNDLKRTDTIILVNVNTDTDDVTMVSIPRDTLVQDELGYDYKINALYQQGIQVLQDEVEEILSVDINYAVEVDYAAFREFIDAIGGITITPTYNMHYEDPKQDLYIHFNKGETVNLKGEEAESFFRWRKNDGELEDGGDGSDIVRIENQQNFISEVLKKCMSPSIITKIPDIVKIVKKNVSTNMSGTEIIQYATEVLAYDFSKIKMLSLGGDFYIKEYPDGTKGDYWIVQEEKNTEIYARLNPNLDPIDLQKENAQVLILNATGIEGLAATMQQDLLNKGYANVEVGNTYSVLDTSSVECEDDKLATEMCTDADITEKTSMITDGYECTVLITIGLDHPLAKNATSQDGSADQ